MSNKKNGGGVIGAIVTFILFMIVVLLLFAPYIMLAAFIYFNPKKRDLIIKLKNNPAFFWLNDKGKSAFIDSYNELTSTLNAMKAAEIRAEKASVKRNKDGTWDGRTKIGKQSKAIIEKCNEKLLDQKEAYEYYRDLPQKLWNEFNRAYLFSEALRMALVAWLCSIIPSSLIFSEGSFVSAVILHFFAPFTFIAGLFTDKISGPYGSDFKILTSSLVVAVLSGCIEYFRKKEEPFKLCSQPPLVTIDNVENYDLEIIKNFIGINKIDGISRESLRDLISILAVFTIADGLVDRFEKFIIKCVINLHWNDQWGDPILFEKEVVSEIEDMDGSVIFSEVVKDKTISLLKGFEPSKIYKVYDLVYKIVWIDNSLTVEEEEILRTFEGTLKESKGDPKEKPEEEEGKTACANVCLNNMISTEDRFDVIFEGTIIEGFLRADVVNSFANLLNIELEKAQLLFSGKHYILKRNSNLEHGKAALRKLHKIGAKSKLVRIANTSSGV